MEVIEKYISIVVRTMTDQIHYRCNHLQCRSCLQPFHLDDQAKKLVDSTLLSKGAYSYAFKSVKSSQELIQVKVFLLHTRITVVIGFGFKQEQFDG